MSEQVYINGNTYILGATINAIPGTGGFTYFFDLKDFIDGSTYDFILVSYNDIGFSGYEGAVSVYKKPIEQRFPIYALAFNWPYDWVSGGNVFAQSTGIKNLLAHSNDLSIVGINYPSDVLGTGTAIGWDRIGIASVETGFKDPLNGTGAFKITLTNNPGGYSRLYQIQEEVKPNTTYTYSFWVNKLLTSSNFTYLIYNTSVKPNVGYEFISGGIIDVGGNEEWVKITNTFKTSPTQYGIAIYPLNRDNSDGSVAYIWGPQLEEGFTSTSFEITKGFKEFNSGSYNPQTNERTYFPNLNLWLNYASSIGATYISPMVRAPFGKNTSRNLSTFMDGWTLSYIMKLSAEQLKALPANLKVISSNNFDYHEMLYHKNDRIEVNGLTGFKFIDDNLIYEREDNYYPGSWNDAGITLYQNYWSEMIDAIYDYGGSVDQVHQDNEDNRSLMWSMNNNSAKTNIALGHVNDARFNREWRGITSWSNIMSNYGATVSKIFDFLDTSGLTHYTIWNYISSKYTGKVFDEIFYQKTKLKNPNVLVSNYNYFQTDAAVITNDIADAPPDPAGHPQFLNSVVGNVSAPYLYGETVPGVAGTGPDVVWKVRSSDPTRLNRYYPEDGENLSTINPTRWTRFILTLQTIRAIKRANPNNIITPWISSENYVNGYVKDISGVEPEETIDKINFYYEAIRHMSVSGIKHFLWWNEDSIIRENGVQIIIQSHFNKMSNVLSEINDRIGGSTPTTMITNRISWFSEYLISGAPSAFGGYWWRVTPKPGYRLNVNGITINSKLKIGDWIYTPKANIPVVTNVEKIS